MVAYTKSETGTNHALAACKSAVSVVRSVHNIDVSNKDNPLSSLHMRIGINSGSIARAEIGAHDRFNFSLVGDVVNLASRLEQLGKLIFPEEKNVILVGHATMRAAAEGDLGFVDCGLQPIRGREHHENVYKISIE